MLLHFTAAALKKSCSLTLMWGDAVRFTGSAESYIYVQLFLLWCKIETSDCFVSSGLTWFDATIIRSAQIAACLRAAAHNFTLKPQIVLLNFIYRLNTQWCTMMMCSLLSLWVFTLDRAELAVSGLAKRLCTPEKKRLIPKTVELLV